VDVDHVTVVYISLRKRGTDGRVDVADLNSNANIPLTTRALRTYQLGEEETKDTSTQAANSEQVKYNKRSAKYFVPDTNK